ncbi:hypothetical protein [Anaplasma phagocytophilum]|uniref:hypothetical protein n=1 Tax=Anaplasma phagocytophilum TaxID=948 RepID=UPI0011A9EF3B|nr:hypothetical protein [Anaplasma phagocytophilum]
MMLLLGRLITLLLLLLRPLVKTSFSLVRRLESLILILIRRFVRRRWLAAVVSMLSMRRRRKISTLEVVVSLMWLFVERKLRKRAAATGVALRGSICRSL